MSESMPESKYPMQSVSPLHYSLASGENRLSFAVTYKNAADDVVRGCDR